MRIAIIEDDPSQLELLNYWLRGAGHQVHTFERGTAFVRTLKHESFDALLLDWNLPEVSGIEVLREMRERLRSRIPVIFITARDQERDAVIALTAGADDYLVKPIRCIELLARLDAVTRRFGAAVLFEVGAFRVDGQMRSITCNSRRLELTGKDFDLASLLLSNVGRVLSRGHLREMIWGQDAVSASRSLDTHVSRVRTKLKLTPEHGWRLSCVYGYGYRLDRLTASDSESNQEGLKRPDATITAVRPRP
jgi:two-component system, OmpR family, response regulator RegX3